LPYIPRQAIQAYWAAVRKACSSNVVTRLGLQGLDDASEVLPSHHADRLSRLVLEDLRPCTTFSELRELYIDFNCSVSLTDADLLELASPRMEELLINYDWGWKVNVDGGGITLSGLVQLLRWRPSLHRVCFAIDSRTFTEIPEGLDVSFPPRKQLQIDFLDSHILSEFVPGIVSVLAALGLDASILEAWETYKWEFVGRELFEPIWKRVLDGLGKASQEQSSSPIVL